MKNSINTNLKPEEIEQLCKSENDLIKHIKTRLALHEPVSFIYKKTKSVEAAVLIPLFFKDGQAHLLFTKRTQTVEHHKGQISFPGGKRDDTDIHLEETALRETDEEMGIKKNDIIVLGQTDRFLTNTHYMVTPFVGTFYHPYQYKVNSIEIERIIEVPLLDLCRDDVFEIKPYTRNKETWQVHYYHFNSDIIWGVTGFLLSNFLTIVFGLPRNIFSQIDK